MRPALVPGDRLLVERRGPVRVGDVVAVRDPRAPARTMLKRPAARGPSGLTVLGDNPGASTDSRSLGPLAPSAVHGRAVYRLQPIRPEVGVVVVARQSDTGPAEHGDALSPPRSSMVRPPDRNRKTVNMSRGNRHPTVPSSCLGASRVDGWTIPGLREGVAVIADGLDPRLLRIEDLGEGLLRGDPER